MFENPYIGVLIGTVPVIVIVLGIVEFSKRLGLSGKWLLIEAMLLGVVFFGTHRLSSMYPSIAVWVELVVYGLGGGLAATGIFDIVNKRVPEVDEQPQG